MICAFLLCVIVSGVCQKQTEICGWFACVFVWFGLFLFCFV